MNLQEADVGMGLFSVVEERLQVVNYTTYLGSDTFTILMKNMESVSKVEGIIAPFQNFVNNFFPYINFPNILSFSGLDLYYNDQFINGPNYLCLHSLA